MDRVRAALRSVGVDEAKYCSHSFRIGTATTAASKGVEDAMIKTLGMWRSLAYLEYVRIPREELGQYSAHHHMPITQHQLWTVSTQTGRGHERGEWTLSNWWVG